MAWRLISDAFTDDRRNGGRHGRRASPASRARLAQGVALADFRRQDLLGHVGEEDVLLVRRRRDLRDRRRIAATITARSPKGWWSATPSAAPGITPASTLRTGEATRAPALNALAVWEVERDEDRIFVQRKREKPKPRGTAHAPSARKNSSSSAAARRALRRPRCCGARTLAAASPC